MLHCNRRIGAREHRQLIPHVRFQVPFLGPESQLKSGFACAGLLCSNSICLLLTKRSCQFLFVGLCCWFCDFAVSFLVPPDGPKNGTVKVVFFCSFTKLCMRSQKWDRQAVPFLGPCLGSFFEVFCIKVAEAQRFGFNEALWLMATGRATVPTLYACCLLNAVVSFCLSAFAVDFAILRSHFWYRQTVPKMGPWKWFSSVLLLSCACGPKNGTARRSHFWDRV